MREDHPVVYDKEKNRIICDNHCKYLNVKKKCCDFFHEHLNEFNEICTQCFLHERNNQVRELIDYNSHILSKFDKYYTEKEKST